MHSIDTLRLAWPRLARLACLARLARHPRSISVQPCRGALSRGLSGRRRRAADCVVPGYTHGPASTRVQPASPVGDMRISRHPLFIWQRPDHNLGTASSRENRNRPETRSIPRLVHSGSRGVHLNAHSWSGPPQRGLPAYHDIFYFEDKKLFGIFLGVLV